MPQAPAPTTQTGSEEVIARILPSLQVAAAVVAIAVGARLATPLPGSPVPQTAQTLAVLAVGVLLGPRLAVLAVVAYLVAGALGAPVFAGGGAGLSRLVGPGGGFLAGFLPAAVTAGWWRRRGWARTLAPAAAGMAVAHIEILALGWAWLALHTGPTAAFATGVAPFLAGAALKSLLAALLAVAVERSSRTALESPG